MEIIKNKNDNICDLPNSLNVLQVNQCLCMFLKKSKQKRMN